jgi:uncharacterized membrane protein
MRPIFLYIFLIVYYAVIEKIIINKFNIKKKKGLFKHFNEIHKWVEVLLIIGTLAMVFVDAYYCLIGLTVLLAFRSFMEWKFEKESKAYILNALNTGVCLLLLIILKLFFK